MILGILLIIIGLAITVPVIVYNVLEMKKETKIQNLITFFIILILIILDGISNTLSFRFVFFIIGLILILLGVLKIAEVF